jgi:hypothetical protein
VFRWFIGLNLDDSVWETLVTSPSPTCPYLNLSPVLSSVLLLTIQQ